MTVDAQAIADAHLDETQRVLTWDGSLSDEHRITAPLAAAGMTLFMSPEGDRVKQGADERCGWLFLDRSKNRSRRWCSMELCGSRDKMRRHYRRTKALRPDAQRA